MHMEYDKASEVNFAGKGSGLLVESAEIARLAAEACDEKKAREITILDIRSISTVADYFVLCTVGSPTQCRAIADHVEEKLEKASVRKHHMEGYANGRWILLDYADIVIHLMNEEEREFYNLERLWGDARRVDLRQSAG